MKGNWNRWLPLLAAVIAATTLWLWWTARTGEGLQLRRPGTDAAPGGEGDGENPVLAGRLIAGAGQPISLAGDWPQFRGPNRDGIARQPPALARDWKTTPPRELWSVDVGEGYAGVAVREGRVFLLDYDREARESALRCLSLADGKEIWRYAYPLAIKRNHGMTRTVPAVTGSFVVAFDSKCNVLCLDAATGEFRWGISLVREFGATVPEWYAGQCPLVDGNKVILAAGGPRALLLAVDLATGRLLWQSPNPRGWKMTHSSIVPMDFAGRRLYAYCASSGVAGVDAADGAMLFETSDWKISIATVPSPVPLPDGRIFFTGGYNAGSLMMQVGTNTPGDRDASPLSRRERGGVRENVANGLSAGDAQPFSLQRIFKLPPEVFGATQHTPVFDGVHLYGVRADGRMVCLGLDGKVVWTSGPGNTFGLGPFLLADGLILALNDHGRLSLIEATPARFHLIGQAQILSGRESWAPLALAGGRLLVRDLTRLVCLDVAARPEPGRTSD